ncbi:patatin-like phospholipase family protein [Acinetobacter portensis]|uniref:Patatin-like phospholipase family protein n=2 Tax=Acinetobacter TaxID=469 RepID=A0A6L6GER2_9GAMM|nr:MULTISPECIES: patatin-like phospholipase family protein [Acinetobacter]MCK7608315.1 patatin-like phospholipase family protein [Acinetobacter portensis]MCK7639075.1 patatin-like phospholipase family protein [Acinetobacter portensis]MDY6456609.1 patatin-like phospholipase family protein [Acinetobacter faecalis]MDY6460464.1 patatin-like phospholipase family protein [Acinetobacter faecalis]MDY6462653.1 patatin-like phospholipase family protein [Acinetobacter faecalis]
MLKVNLIFGCVIIFLTGCQSIPQVQQNKNKTAAIAPHTLDDAREVSNQINFKNLKKDAKKPIIALVLGSGGARGYAHIGAIEILEKNNIHPDFIVGTSAGSIVGSLYASGKNSSELREIALNLKANDVRDVTLDKKGFFEGKKVEDFINKEVNNTPLQSLKIPMYVIATELKEGKKVVFNYGNTGQAVRASVAIPSMFIPTKIGDDEYVDGGLVSPVPVDVAKKLGADIVIAVDILAQPVHTETSNIWGLFNQNINIMQKHLAQEELKGADIVIQPDLREKVHIFDVSGREITMLAGQNATQKILPELRKIIDNYPLLKRSNRLIVKE